MTANLIILITFVILQRFLGAPNFPELMFVTYAILLTLGTLTLINAFSRLKHLQLISWIGTGAIILITVLIPALGLMQLRLTEGSVDGIVHDDPIQIEAAIEFLIDGKNPYVEDYTQTDLVAWSNNFLYDIVNPAIYHVVALPGHLILSTVLYLPIHGLTGFFDERIVYMLAYLAAVLLAYHLGRTPVERLRSVILIGLNPLLISYTVAGRNDIFVFAFLLAALLMLYRQRWLTAFVLLGFACTIKLFAWVFVPFVIAYAAGHMRGHQLTERLRHLIRPVIGMAAVIAILIGPFVLWNLPALYDDVVRYTNGTSPTSYPINGLGISTMLMHARVINHPTDYYPFWIFQVLTVVPLLIFVLPRLYRQPDVWRLVFGASFTLFVGMFFSRFMNENYLVLVMLLAAAGYGFWTLEQRLHDHRS